MRVATHMKYLPPVLCWENQLWRYKIKRYQDQSNPAPQRYHSSLELRSTATPDVTSQDMQCGLCEVVLTVVRTVWDLNRYWYLIDQSPRPCHQLSYTIRSFRHQHLHDAVARCLHSANPALSHVKLTDLRDWPCLILYNHWLMKGFNETRRSSDLLILFQTVLNLGAG